MARLHLRSVWDRSWRGAPRIDYITYGQSYVSRRLYIHYALASWRGQPHIDYIQTLHINECPAALAITATPTVPSITLTRPPPAAPGSESHVFLPGHV